MALTAEPVTLESLQSQIRSLELEIQSLKAQLAKLAQASAPRHFGDFYGAIPEWAAITEEDIAQIEYRVPPDIEE